MTLRLPARRWKAPRCGEIELGKSLRKYEHVDLLRAADPPGHGGRGRDPGGDHPAISIPHDVRRAQELDVRDIRCPPRGSG